MNRDMGYAIYKIATVGHLTTSKPNTPSKLWLMLIGRVAF